VESDHERVKALSKDYAIAVAHYAWAFGEMNRQRPTASKKDYELLNRIVEEAHNECERLRMALQRLRP